MTIPGGGGVFSRREALKSVDVIKKEENMKRKRKGTAWKLFHIRSETVGKRKECFMIFLELGWR